MVSDQHALKWSYRTGQRYPVCTRWLLEKSQMGLSANGRLRVKAHSGKHGNPSSILGKSRGTSCDARIDTIAVKRKKQQNKKKELVGAQQLTLGKLQIPIVI